MFSEPARDILNGQGSIQDYGLLAIEIGVVALAAAPVAVGVDAIGLATALYAVGGGLGIGGGAVAEVANIEEMAKIQS